ncbi:MAG: TIGR03960 family B12-binding radical SAM protein [Desulfobacterium sp.]|nr:TIGR03960 family B12-binding radical SAM protein [Desulfobacterium sp.]
MNKRDIQELLPLVEMPSRYLGNEANTIKKERSSVDLTFALAFPDLYEIGTSHFGMQILYTILNQEPKIAAERVFTPAPDMEELLRESRTPLCSLESRTPLADFDIIGFSLLYELNFTNILTMLDLAGIPFYANQRPDTFPLVIAGGPCAFNPEPLADFFDLFVVGDGEEAIVEISKIVMEWKAEHGISGSKSTHDRQDDQQSPGQNGPQNDRQSKQALLKRLARVQGVYVPSFYRADFDDRGFQLLEPLFVEHATVKRAILTDLAKVPFPTEPIVPFGKPVHDRLRLEIARGCSRGCRFCQAGMIYRPVRERTVPDLVEMTRTAMAATGYSDVSLLSLSTGDYSDLATLMEALLAINSDHCTAISLPSIRAGRLTPELMRIIKRVKKTGFTIAPEAGTQRLRDAINKNISEQDIVDTVTNAFDLGWRIIKLYFMNGLPTETQEDIQGICDLALKLAAINSPGKGQGKGKAGSRGRAKANINVSFATFIPKAHTPFQRSAQISTQHSMDNLNFLKQNLRHPGINLKWQNPEMSLLEGVWARGDRRLSKVLVTAWEKGCRLDGWSDKFNFDLWMEAFNETGVDPAFFTTRQRSFDEPLPWAHIDCGVSSQFMDQELKKATTGETTPDCREEGCMGCGICDFETVEPIIHPLASTPGAPGKLGSLDESIGPDKPNRPPPRPADNTPLAKYRVFYSRLGDARHFGHLELAKIIRRAIRRTGIKVAYSKGFNPGMLLSFDDPLPIGMESQEEFFTITAATLTSPRQIVTGLNRVLPETISITGCSPLAALRNSRQKGEETTRYSITLNGSSMDQREIDDFMALSEFQVEKRSFKGKTRTTDLRKVVRRIDFLDSSRIEMVLVKDDDRTIRPAEILTTALGLSERAVQTAKILKLKQENPIC